MNPEKIIIVIIIIGLATTVSKVPDVLFKSIRRLGPFILVGVVILKLPEIIDLSAQVINTLWPAIVGIVQRSSETLADMLTAISR